MAACNCDTFDRSVVITAASNPAIDPLTLSVVNDYGDNRRTRLYLGTSHPVAGSIQGQPAIQIGAAQGDKAQQRLRIVNHDGSEIACFTHSGKIGIGTATPDTQLQIGSGVSAGSDARIRMLTVNAGATATRVWEVGASYAVYGNGGLAIRNAAQNDASVTVLDDGRVGIGTTSPAGKFEVRTGENTRFLVTDDGRVGIGSTQTGTDVAETATGGVRWDAGRRSGSRAAADLGMLGRAVGDDRADPGGARPAEAGAAEDRPARGVRRDHLSAADGVPVEPVALGVPRR